MPFAKTTFYVNCVFFMGDLFSNALSHSLQPDNAIYNAKCATMPNVCPFPSTNYFSMSRPKMALYGLHKWHCTHIWHCLRNQMTLNAQLALCVLHKRHCMHNWHCIDGKMALSALMALSAYMALITYLALFTMPNLHF